MQPSLHIGLKQQQVLAPQLRQSLKLLQIPLVELQVAITQALEENIFLEIEENTQEPPLEIIDAIDNDGQSSDSLSEDAADGEPSLNDTWSDLEPRLSHSKAAQGSSDADITLKIEQMATEATTLNSYIHKQVLTLHLDAKETAIAEAVIDAINDEGYLSVRMDYLAEILSVPLKGVLNVLQKIQQAVPAGIGATDLQERLLMQLEMLETKVSVNVLNGAMAILSQHLNLLVRKEYKALKKKVGLTSEAFAQAIELIQSLNPYPAAKLVTQTIEAVTPDVFVTKIKGQWQLKLNQNIIPRLNVNSVYAQQIPLMTAKSDEQEKLKQQLSDAEQFIQGVNNRFETLAQVAQIAIEFQSEFLEHGEDCLKPLQQMHIAKKMSVHESTVSRAIAGKYVQTPHGVFELKHFLSHQAAQQDNSHSGLSLSAAALRAKIRLIIEGEPAIKPYNDELIAKKLLEQGVKIARRTVVKHREALHIPSSRERKRQKQSYTDL